MTLAPASLWPAVARLSGVKWPPADQAEALTFIRFADRERLFPLLLEQPGSPGTIRDTLPQFRALAALHKSKYELSRKAILELNRVIGADSFVLLKGSDYRFRLYSNPILRPLTDIDLLVQRPARPRLAGALTAAGHTRVYSSHGATWSPGFHEYQCLIGPMLVELHHAFAQRVRARIPYDAVWQRREPFEGDGYRGFRLGPVDAMLHHAVSLAKDEFSAPLIRYFDMFLFLQTPGRDLDACVESARQWQAQTALYGALHLTMLFFPEARDEAVEQATARLLSSRRRAFTARRVLPDPRIEVSGHPRGRLAQLWRKFWLMDVTWRRFAFFAVHIIASLAGYTREWLSRRKESGIIRLT